MAVIAPSLKAIKSNSWFRCFAKITGVSCLSEDRVSLIFNLEAQYVKHGKLTATFTNYKDRLSYVVRWYGQYLEETGPLSLVDLPLHEDLAALPH